MADAKWCKSCWNIHQQKKWYTTGTEKFCDSGAECGYHSRLSNWRVIRTLKALKVWSLEKPGYRHRHVKGVLLTLDGGWVHKRTAQAILFDYEQVYIDFLLFKSFLEIRLGTPTCVRVTEEGDRFLRECQKRAEEDGSQHGAPPLEDEFKKQEAQLRNRK